MPIQSIILCFRALGRPQPEMVELAKIWPDCGLQFEPSSLQGLWSGPRAGRVYIVTDRPLSGVPASWLPLFGLSVWL